MAFRTQKISQMTPKGADLEATDLIEVSTIESGSYVTRSITGQELIDAIPAPTGFVPTSRTLTINGVAQDLSADRSWTIATGLTVGTTPISSGTIGRVLFQGTGNVLQQSSSLFWDSTNNRLGIGTATPLNIFSILTNLNTSAGIRVQNTNSSSSAVAGVDLISDSTQGSLFATSSTYSTYGVLSASSVGFYTTSSFNIALDSNTANFSVGIGSGNPSAKFRVVGSTGNVLINTTTDAGFKLDVNGTARVSGTLTLNNTSGTNRSTQLSTSGSSDNLPSISFYPATGTNVGQSFDIIPKGTGYSSGIKTQFGIWGTDFIANQTNYELLLVRATGSSYTFESFKGGTGAHRPILLSAGVSNQLWAYTSGNIGINTTTDAGFRLDVNGTARVRGTGTTIGTTSFTVQDSASSDLFRVYDNGLVAIKAGVISLNGSNGSISGGFIASTGQIISGGTSITASAQMEVISTTRGFLPPRMTTTQKNAIASPATGLQVYDTTLNQMSYYNGTTWTNI